MREIFIREKMPPCAPAVTQILQQSFVSCHPGEHPQQSVPDPLAMSCVTKGTGRCFYKQAEERGVTAQGFILHLL